MNIRSAGSYPVNAYACDATTPLPGLGQFQDGRPSGVQHRHQTIGRGGDDPGEGRGPTGDLLQGNVAVALGDAGVGVGAVLPDPAGLVNLGVGLFREGDPQLDRRTVGAAAEVGVDFVPVKFGSKLSTVT